jgi:hypothetical protein
MPTTRPSQASQRGSTRRTNPTAAEAIKATPSGSIPSVKRAPPTWCRGSCAGEAFDRWLAVY